MVKKHDLNRRADTTPPYWMAKLFAVLGGVQDATTLSGRVWIDETCFPVAAKVAVRSAGRSPGARGRELRR